VYTRQEWKQFIRWKKWKRGYIHFMVHLFFTPSDQPTPEIKITGEMVSIGDKLHYFSNEENRLKRIDIRDEGKMNIMEFTFQWSKRKVPATDELQIPVPKGKLKEAIEIVERLQMK
jgi:hypothetical protein